MSFDIIIIVVPVWRDIVREIDSRSLIRARFIIDYICDRKIRVGRRSMLNTYDMRRGTYIRSGV